METRGEPGGRVGVQVERPSEHNRDSSGTRNNLSGITAAGEHLCSCVHSKPGDQQEAQRNLLLIKTNTKRSHQLSTPVIATFYGLMRLKSYKKVRLKNMSLQENIILATKGGGNIRSFWSFLFLPPTTVEHVGCMKA